MLKLTRGNDDAVSSAFHSQLAIEEEKSEQQQHDISSHLQRDYVYRQQAMIMGSSASNSPHFGPIIYSPSVANSPSPYTLSRDTPTPPALLSSSVSSPALNKDDNNVNMNNNVASSNYHYNKYINNASMNTFNGNDGTSFQTQNISVKRIYSNTNISIDEHNSSIEDYDNYDGAQYRYSSNGKVNAPTYNQRYPKIYSAIGSLENSYGSGHYSRVSYNVAHHHHATLNSNESSLPSEIVKQGAHDERIASPPTYVNECNATSFSGTALQGINLNHHFAQHPHYRSHFLPNESLSNNNSINTENEAEVNVNYMNSNDDRINGKPTCESKCEISSHCTQGERENRQRPIRDSESVKKYNDVSSAVIEQSIQSHSVSSKTVFAKVQSEIKSEGVENSEDIGASNLNKQLHAVSDHSKSYHKQDGIVGKSKSEGALQDHLLSSDGEEVTYKKKRTKKKVKVNEVPTETFRPSSDAYTPRVNSKKINYKPAKDRASTAMSTTMGTISRPNFRDALRRVAMIIQQHVVKIEKRNEERPISSCRNGLFSSKMMDMFSEDNFLSPRYKYTMVRLPMARPGIICSMRPIKSNFTIPMEDEIYEFAHRLFKSVQLSSECSIVCLIYVERLMEIAKVPLMAHTWRPIVMCGLLLASKVWQDLSSWNIEFSSVYPQFSLESISRLELLFLRQVKWDLYISSSLYAKYYFALRSLLEKKSFRVRYNQMVGASGRVDLSQAYQIQKRTEQVKEESLNQLSQSM